MLGATLTARWPSRGWPVLGGTQPTELTREILGLRWLQQSSRPLLQSFPRQLLVCLRLRKPQEGHRRSVLRTWACQEPPLPAAHLHNHQPFLLGQRGRAEAPKLADHLSNVASCLQRWIFFARMNIFDRHSKLQARSPGTPEVPGLEEGGHHASCENSRLCWALAGPLPLSEQSSCELGPAGRRSTQHLQPCGRLCGSLWLP